MTIAHSPVELMLQQAVALHQVGDFARARALYENILAIHPRHFDAMHLSGVIAAQSGNPRLAAALIGDALRIKPRDPVAHGNRGAALQELEQWDAALENYDQATALAPENANGHYQRGNVLCRVRRYEAAIASYDQAIRLKPDFAEAYSNRGLALNELRQLETALASFDRAILLRPDYPEAHSNRASVLRELRRYDEAIASYERAFAIKSDLKYLRGMRLHAKMYVCDWSGFDAELARLTAAVEHGEPALNPFAIMTLSGSPGLLRKAAERWVRTEFPSNPALGPIAKRPPGDKIRVGYFSADFRNHPVAMLTAELFELHDRTRFDITAFSFGHGAQDQMRERLQKAFDAFIDVRHLSDRDIALLARRSLIDIAVDLGGFTEGARPGIFAMRAAPIQASYIGYLGTMGAAYVDYLIADPVIVPEANRRHYSEQIAYLPSYQANDSKRLPADHRYTREELGLPPTAFVFCCFNASFKITPATFAIWMAILRAAPRSVLYLFAENPTAQSNLRHAARRSGVDPGRLYFGERLSVPLYLARYRAADLFLDTFPYNAGTTASDALWAGLPVLTCIGESFSGRVAASLLTAIRLPELIASTPAEYERIAVALATDPGRLAGIKQKLAENRLVAPLFDTPLFTKGLEAVYLRMFERHHQDLPPEHIDADPAADSRFAAAQEQPAPSASAAPPAPRLPARFQQAVSWHREGRLADAQSLYDDILAAEPRHFNALHLSGMLAAQRGDPARAVELIGAALDVDPDNALAQFNLGSALDDLKQWDPALAAYDRAIAIKGDFAEAHANRGLVLQKLERCGEAAASYRRALAINPDFATAHSNLGAALKDLGNLEGAIASCERAVSIEPNHAEAHCNRGNALRELGELSAALAGYDRAIAIRPDYAAAHVNRGNLLVDLMRLTEARESFDRAIALQADCAEAYFSRGILSLLGGDFERGLVEYEWRWKVPGGPSSKERRDFRQPLWLGDASLAGKRILLHGEQGLGDTLQFCRYAQRVADLDATVILEVPGSLVGLLSGLRGVSRLLTKGDELPDFDFHCPLMSLPLAFRTTPERIPAAAGYLRGDAEMISRWQARLGPRTRPRIGLAWSGSTKHPNDRRRSVAFAQLMRSLPPAFHYFCLQKEVRAAERHELETHANLAHFPNDLNFPATAALCEVLDLVISVDTSIAHLSAALGKKTWVLLPFNPDWRWLLNRADSPWYPSATLYRQERFGDWDGVLSRVASDLIRLFEPTIH
jgi:predicted O-linked N-acetylglucosamine transferase (SPINDLY family)